MHEGKCLSCVYENVISYLCYNIKFQTKGNCHLNEKDKRLKSSATTNVSIPESVLSFNGSLGNE